MKRPFFIAALLFLLLMVSCEEEAPYKIGDVGPAGGIIIYDCDADNRGGNGDGLKSKTCGWRYMEIAPVDVSVESQTLFAFGYCRTSDAGSNMYSDGLTGNHSWTKDFFTGASNTRRLLEAMGNEAYRNSTGSDKTSNYAAKVADNFEYGGYDDWFLPSVDELWYVTDSRVLQNASVRIENGYYSTSSEADSADKYWGVQFGLGQTGLYNFQKSVALTVRCVRTFLPDEV